jgi:hypothetical protein
MSDLSRKTTGLLAAIMLAVTAGSAQAQAFYVTQHWNGSVDDVKGEVGYPIHVDGPHAQGCSGQWSEHVSIVSGQLPPGVSLPDGLGVAPDFTGIPTERGHWVVTVQADNIQCNGQTYPLQTFRQQLRFHITGTGEVH